MTWRPFASAVLLAGCLAAGRRLVWVLWDAYCDVEAGFVPRPRVPSSSGEGSSRPTATRGLYVTRSLDYRPNGRLAVGFGVRAMGARRHAQGGRVTQDRYVCGVCGAAFASAGPYLAHRRGCWADGDVGPGSVTFAPLPPETDDERDRNAKQAELLRKVRNSVPGLKL